MSERKADRIPGPGPTSANYSVVPRGKVMDVAAMLKTIHAQEDQAAAREKAKVVVQKLREMKLREAAKKVEDSVAETLTYMVFPHENWLKIRSNNAIERLNREIRRRTRVVGAFPVSNAIIFDKTGTLTEGQFGVTDITAIGISEAELF